MPRLLSTALLLAVFSTGNCWALDVLVNQVGYEPNSPKVFHVQRASDYAGRPRTSGTRRLPYGTIG